MLFRKTQIFTVLTILALTLSACGSASNQSIIATSVAMTVQAQNSQPTATLQDITDTPSVPTPPTAEATKAPPTAPPTSSGNVSGTCASASLVSETVPDGTIIAPGAQFTKTWRIKNTGTCAWDSTWKLVFVSGDLMGGAYIYNFPQPAQPDETVDVPIVLTAPQQNGTYKGDWQLQSPWGGTFGVGQYNSPFWVSIVVGSGTPANNKTATVYDVTAVTYNVVRDPVAGCPTNVTYTVNATIATNGPVTVNYMWVQSDGNNDKNNTLVFTDAGTKTVSREWKLHLGSATNTRWMQIIITSPTYQEYGKATFDYTCGQ